MKYLKSLLEFNGNNTLLRNLWHNNILGMSNTNVKFRFYWKIPIELYELGLLKIPIVPGKIKNDWLKNKPINTKNVYVAVNGEKDSPVTSEDSWYFMTDEEWAELDLKTKNKFKNATDFEQWEIESYKEKNCGKYWKVENHTLGFSKIKELPKDIKDRILKNDPMKFNFLYIAHFKKEHNFLEYHWQVFTEEEFTNFTYFPDNWSSPIYL